jgi:hypothetical protein
MMNNPNTTVPTDLSVAENQTVSRRILVMHSRAITQLVEIRSRKTCRKFANLAAIAARSRSAKNNGCSLEGAGI